MKRPDRKSTHGWSTPQSTWTSGRERTVCPGPTVTHVTPERVERLTLAMLSAWSAEMKRLVAKLGPRLAGIHAAEAEEMIRRELVDPLNRDLDTRIDLLEEQLCAVQQ